MDTSTADTEINTTTLQPDQTYWWHVRAANKLGNSGWSQEWSFSTLNMQLVPPVLSTPANGTSGLPTTVVFSWNAVDGAEAYDVQVATDPLFGSIVLDDSGVTAASLTAGSLSSGTLYYWRVRTEYGAGAWSAFSSSWEFKTSSKVLMPGDVDVAIDVGYPTLSDTTTLKPSDYRLVGLPGTSNLPLSQVFHGTAGATWQAYWDNGAPSDYLVKYNPALKDSVFSFSLGRAFWVINEGPLVVDTTVAAAPLDSVGRTEIPLHQGWNLITDPFADSISWGPYRLPIRPRNRSTPSEAPFRLPQRCIRDVDITSSTPGD